MNLDARIIALAQAIGADIKALISGKVDKVAGKVLSANDYTTNEKTQLAGTPGAISSAVASALRQYRGDGGGISGNITLDSSYAGKWVSVTATGAVVIMPSVDAMLSGQTVRILNRSGGQITLTAQGTQGIVVNAISYPSITLEKGEYMEFSANTGNLAWYEVAHGWLDNVSILPTLSALGSQNLYYNAGMRLSSVANVADGWRLDAPGTVGASTGVMTLVPSFMNPDENAQRFVVTGLNISALYRSLTIDPAFPTRVGEGQDAVASVFVKGTAGLGLRIFFQAINASSVVINTINGLVNVLDGTIQRFSLNYANLPAGTVRVQVFYRLYASAVTDGTVDFARPQCQVGPLSGWNEDTRIKANVGDALVQMQSFGIGSPIVPALSDYNSATMSGIYRGSSGSTLNEPAGTNTTILFNGRYSTTGGFQLVGELQANTAGTRLFARGQFGGTYYGYREVAFTDNASFTGPFTVSTGEVRNVNSIAYRQVNGNYGSFWFQDGGSLYLMLTNSGDQYGTYNALRPLAISLASGLISIGGNGLNVSGAATFQAPIRPAQYTTGTRPSVAAFNGHLIECSDQIGGPQIQRSNGTAWLPLNVGPWTALTVGAGVTASTVHPPQYRMIDDCVEIRGKVTLTAALAINTAFTIATLPTGFRPAGMTTDTEVIRLPACCATAIATAIQFQANRVGSCAVVPGTALAAGAIIDLSNVRFSTAA